MITIRDATEEDVPLVYRMLYASAVEQGFPDELVASEEDLRVDGFGTHSRFRVLLAFVDSQPAGMALFYVSFSTWGSRFSLYLEDLYVAADFRRSGVALALFRRLAQAAVEERCTRLEWVVHSGNTRAMRFYESIGARSHEGWFPMSISGAALHRLV